MITREQAEKRIKNGGLLYLLVSYDRVLHSVPLRLIDNDSVLLDIYGVYSLDSVFFTRKDAVVEMAKVFYKSMSKNIKAIKNGSIIARNIRDAFDKLYTELYDKENK